MKRKLEIVDHFDFPIVFSLESSQSFAYTLLQAISVLHIPFKIDASGHTLREFSHTGSFTVYF